MFKIMRGPQNTAALGLQLDVALVERNGVEGLLIGGQFIPRGEPMAQYVRFDGPFDERTCDDCFAFMLKVFKVDDPKKPELPMHPRCRHFYTPVDMKGRTLRELKKEEPDLTSYLKNLGPEAIRAVFGVYRSKLVQAGKVNDVADLYSKKNVLISVKQLKQEFGAL